jgi:hypothetical protein
MLTAPLFLSLIENVNGFHIPGYCIFKIITGIDCPGCGMTNSAMELFRGNIQDSINLHPAGLVIISILAITTSYMVISLAFQGNPISWQKEIKISNFFERLAMVALAIGWASNILTR